MNRRQVLGGLLSLSATTFFPKTGLGTMPREGWQHLKDPALREIFTQHKNLIALEELIGKEEERFHRLAQDLQLPKTGYKTCPWITSERKIFGAEVREEELRDLLNASLKSVISSVVGIAATTPVEIGYSPDIKHSCGGSYYKFNRPLQRGEIYFLPPEERETLPRDVAQVLLAHEYTHELQRITAENKGIDIVKERNNFSIFPEGHARGVQRRTADILSAQEHNPSYSFIATKYVLGDLHGAYDWLKKELRTNHRENRRKEIDPHRIGTALFLIHEREDPQIYRDVLQGKYHFW